MALADAEGRPVPEPAAAGAAIQLLVRAPSAPEALHVFNGEDPLDEQVCKLCEHLGVGAGEEEGYILTRSVGSDLFVFHSAAQLFLVPMGTRTDLQRAKDVVHARLAA